MSRPLSRRDEQARKRYILLSHRPYLRRNVLKYLRKMGNLLSSLKKTPAGSKRPHDESSFALEEEEEDSRPIKRRRIIDDDHGELNFRDSPDDDTEKSTVNVRGESTGVSPHASSSRLGLPPSDFYGKSRSASNLSSSGSAVDRESSTDDLVNGFVPKFPVKFQPAMRVEVVSINPLQNQHEEFGQDLDRTVPTEFLCKCSVAVWAKNKHIYSPEIGDENFELVCKKVHDCKIRVTFGPDGDVSREILMSEPFLFKANDLFVTTRRRKKNGRSGASETTYDLASEYKLLVDIKKIRHHDHWPPVDIPPENPISKALRDNDLLKDDLIFICQADPTKNCLSVSPQLQVAYGKLKKQPLQYAVKLEVRWSTPSNLTARAIEASRVTVESKLAALELNLPPPPDPVSPGPRREEEISAANSPTRSQRHRTAVPTYNLKQTFRDQLGRKPLKTKDEGGAPSVTYYFGKSGVGEIGGKHQWDVPDLNCPFCIMTCYNDFNELFIHLTTDHSCFKFTAPRRNKAPKFSVFIEISAQRPGSPIANVLELQRTFQLNQASSLFNLNKYVNGDETWIKNRFGPQHNLAPPHLLPTAHDSSHSSSPHDSQRSSPNTSTSSNDKLDFEPPVDISNTLFIEHRIKKCFFVPETSTPLYDTITKQVLRPGVELPDSDDENDEFWLDMKHRDTVMDYTDVTPEEKEYANKWNLFITKEKLPSSKFLDKAVIKFAQETKPWLVEKHCRIAEFLKQIEVFILRGDIDEDVRDSVVLILRKAWKAEKLKENGDTVMKEAPSPPPRNRNACSCGKIPSPHERMLCNGAKCPARFFHKNCAKDMGRPLLPLREWKCNRCFS